MRLLPYEIQFQKIGNPEIGFLSIASFQNEIPFEIKRVFVNYATPEDVMRGGHAHHATEMVLSALLGEIELNIIDQDLKEYSFQLNQPNQGVYIPRGCWHTMTYSKHAIQLVICSTLYDEGDYIRDYQEFLSINNRS